MRRLLFIPCALLACGCQSEERIINYKPFMAGLDSGGSDVTVRSGQAYVKDGEVVGAGRSGDDQRSTQIVIEHDDGSVTLIARSGSHLMRHIQRTLYEGERDVFTEQVLSEVTKAEFRERGRDPAEAFDALKETEREIAELFSRMPLGEHTPQVIMDKVGRNMFRVRVTGVGVNDLYWRGFDMVLEEGNWKLRWFVR
jgi:hypothetical protein